MRSEPMAPRPERSVPPAPQVDITPKIPSPEEIEEWRAWKKAQLNLQEVDKNTPLATKIIAWCICLPILCAICFTIFALAIKFCELLVHWLAL